MISTFDPNIPAQESRLQSEPVRNNFRALNDRTNQLTPTATSPISTNVTIGAADKIYFDDNKYLPFPGGNLDLGDSTTGVSAFNTPGTFKEVVVFYENSSGTGVIGFIESSEKFTRIRDTENLINNSGEQVDPDVGSLNTTGNNLLDGKIIICSILVTNSGTTGQRGQIVQIGTADILDLRPYMQIGGRTKELDEHINAATLVEAHPTAKVDNSIINVISTTLSSSASATDKVISVASGQAALFEAGEFIRIPTTNIAVNQITPDINFITAQIYSKNETNDTLTLDRQVGQSIPSGRLVIRGSLTLDRMGYDVATALEEVTGGFLRIQTNMSNESEYKLGLNTVFDENVDSTAAIAGTKIVPSFGIQNISTAGTVQTTNTTESSSTGTGSIQTDGGLGVVKNAYVGGLLNVASSASIGSSLMVTTTAQVGGILSVTDTTDASSPITGSFKTSGGIGVSKNAYIGGSLYTGSSNIQLTDATGNILSSALNTVAVSQGGTGRTTLTDNSSGTIDGTVVKTNGTGAVNFVNYSSDDEATTLVYRNASGNFATNEIVVNNLDSTGNLSLQTSSTTRLEISDDQISSSVGHSYSVRSVATSPITVTLSDYLILCSGAILQTVNLPGSPPEGTTVIVKNTAGAGGDDVTIDSGLNSFDTSEKTDSSITGITSTNITIDGASRGAVTLMYSAGTWWIVSRTI